MSKRKKYLVETSCVRPALGWSTPNHIASFQARTADGDLWGSTYVRMEFIRLWVCQVIQIALTIYHFKSVENALIHLEQDFNIRKVKASVATIAAYLGKIGSIDDTQAASEECGRLAILFIAKYDSVFPSRITNVSKCERGGVELVIDYEHLLDDLQRFYTTFQDPVMDCEVNAFLKLRSPKSASSKLMGDSELDDVKVVKNLIKYRNSDTKITCDECSTIGDAVVSLEMPKSWVLAHTDRDMGRVCDSLGKMNLYLPSQRAAERDAGNAPPF